MVWHGVSMCTNYVQVLTEKKLAEAFAAQIKEAPSDAAIAAPAGSIFPKRDAYVVRQRGSARIIETMRWGFPPPPQGRAPVVNVRNLTSPFWRGILNKPDFRCLVPVTSFSEWQGEKGSKVQRWFNIPSRPVFAFAGIWRPTDDGNVFAFLTCAPNPLVAAIHPKAMPVILDEADHTTWLAGDTAEQFAQPYPSQLMALESLEL